MRLKDVYGKLTKDTDIELVSGNDSMNIVVDSNNKIIFNVESSGITPSMDLRYQLADPRILSHLTDTNNPHQNIGYFIEKYVEDPASGAVIYETVAPLNVNSLLTLSSIECYVFPTLNTETQEISMDILRNDESVFSSEVPSSEYYSDINNYSSLYITPLRSDGWYQDSKFTFNPGDDIKVKIKSCSENIERTLIRLVFW